MRWIDKTLIFLLLVLAAFGCQRKSTSEAVPRVAAQSPRPAMTVRLRERPEELGPKIAIFESVFWEPEDTASLRRLIRDTPLVQGKRVLEIGTGSGLISLYCLRAGASSVVATDVNPAAVANAQYNVAGLQLPGERFEARQVPLDDSGAFSVVREGERFDLIISNPPWEDAAPAAIDEYALYDDNFALLDSLLAGLPEHLAPDGRALLAYGCVTAIRTLCDMAEERGLQVRALDERDLDSLPELFLPGMLLEVTVAAAGQAAAPGGADAAE